MKTRQMPIVPWNSHVALFDFLPEEPLNTNKLVLEFTACDWFSPGNPNRSKPGEEEVVHNLRSIVLH
jgi:hypothetical protein